VGEWRSFVNGVNNIIYGGKIAWINKSLWINYQIH
jgi:hypothetical protein